MSSLITRSWTRVLITVIPAWIGLKAAVEGVRAMVLLIEVARSDDRVEDHEQGIIERALVRRFGLNHSEAAHLIKVAKAGAIQATDLFHFTKVVVDNFTEDERIGVTWAVPTARRLFFHGQNGSSEICLVLKMI
jgi:hypothetical protein